MDSATKTEFNPVVYSIFINNVNFSTRKKEITEEFNKMNLGKIEHVEMIEKSIPSWRGNTNFWQVTVYYSTWNESNSYALNLRNNLDNGIHQVHNYWKNATEDPEEWQLENNKPVRKVDLDYWSKLYEDHDYWGKSYKPDN